MAQRGRPKGSVNSNTKGLRAQLKREFGQDYDVVMMMAEQAQKMIDVANNECDPHEQFHKRKECVHTLDKIAQYVQPKLKAIEITDAEGNNALPTAITFNLVDATQS